MRSGGGGGESVDPDPELLARVVWPRLGVAFCQMSEDSPEVTERAAPAGVCTGSR